ncbi:hypothetical protein CHS0354_017964 [Potamilus streckersoni]|uniref:RING-type domain-containing protein n=1 Tax=Potamilus streckersoni TaxID=2493646 RepID=A0AAE0VKZ7_9BIVA|nr:hypothetical protein CHS0354_017964 [Potamilus streckersoni]
MMGQALAKRDIHRGIILYDEQKFSRALEIWLSVLSKLRKPQDRFSVHGYVCMALLETGYYKEALEHALRQVDIAEWQNKDILKSEAFYNTARAFQTLGEMSKCLTFCERSLNYETDIPALPGYVHLCMGCAFLALGLISKAYMSLQFALDTSEEHEDKVLELMTRSSLANVFTAVRDYETAREHHWKAIKVARVFEAVDSSFKFMRRVLANAAVVMLKVGSYSDALDIAEEAIKDALTFSDRPVQSKCLFIFAEVHRERYDLKTAYPRYEAAYELAHEIGDQKLQMEIIMGMARAAEAEHDLLQAYTLAEKSYNMSMQMSCKLEAVRCLEHQSDLAIKLDRPEVSENSDYLRGQLLQELELYCGICDEPLGDRPGRLEVLDCCHFVHQKCARYLLRASQTQTVHRCPCPACRTKMPITSTTTF